MSSAADATPDFEEFLTFRLGEQEFGVQIQQVQGIQGWDKVTEIPETPPHVLGVIDLRGTVVPIIDLRRRLGFSRIEFGTTTVVIVVKVQAEDQERTFGLVVDAVSEVCDVPASERKESPDFGGGIRAEFMLGLATVEERMIILLDLDRLMNDTDFGTELEEPIDELLYDATTSQAADNATHSAAPEVAEPGPDADAIEESFALIAPEADALVAGFYEELLKRYPDVAPMFENTDMAEQRRKLIGAIGLVVQNVRRPEALSEPLAALGARHQEIGAVAEHYDAVAQTMLTVLAATAGDAWNERFETAWTKALGLVAAGMLAGYADTSAAAAGAPAA